MPGSTIHIYIYIHTYIDRYRHRDVEKRVFQASVGGGRHKEGGGRSMVFRDKKRGMREMREEKMREMMVVCLGERKGGGEEGGEK